MSFDNNNNPIFEKDPFQSKTFSDNSNEDSNHIKNEKYPKVKENNWIESENNKIPLIKVIDQSFYEGHLVLKNQIDKYVVFKFKNEKVCYHITPCLYFIKPYSTVIINIKRFERLDLSSQVSMKDTIQLIAAKANREIKDVNEAKIYLKKEDIYSPEYQVYKFEIELDNGNNISTYNKVIEERKTILNEYNKQLNMNMVSSCEEVKKYISQVKKEIEEYQERVDDLLSKLGDMNKDNIIKQPEVIFNIETYNKIYSQRVNTFNQDKMPITAFIFLICLSLFIGKLFAFLSR